MSPNFPSIWIEWEIRNRKNTIIGGFYREWTQVGTTTERGQLEMLEILTEQITRANAEGKNVIMMRNANLNSEKWKDQSYRHYNVAAEMQNTLARNGMKNVPIGNTFLADKTRPDRRYIENALDLPYIQKNGRDYKGNKGENECN
jgi:hypothetical protein